MKRISQWIVAVLLSFSVIGPVFAMEKMELYTADVPLTGQTAVERQRVMPTALQQALIKVTGNSAISSLKPIQDGLSQANDLVQSYNYKTQMEIKNKQRIATT